MKKVSLSFERILELRKQMWENLYREIRGDVDVENTDVTKGLFASRVTVVKRKKIKGKINMWKPGVGLVEPEK